MVVDAIHITSKRPDFGKEDIRIEWNTSETKVGLFIRNELWAAFDAEGKKHGGNYELGTRPNIPDVVSGVIPNGVRNLPVEAAITLGELRDARVCGRSFAPLRMTAFIPPDLPGSVCS